MSKRCSGFLNLKGNRNATQNQVNYFQQGIKLHFSSIRYSNALERVLRCNIYSGYALKYSKKIEANVHNRIEIFGFSTF